MSEFDQVYAKIREYEKIRALIASEWPEARLQELRQAGDHLLALDTFLKDPDLDGADRAQYLVEAKVRYQRLKALGGDQYDALFLKAERARNAISAALYYEVKCNECVATLRRFRHWYPEDFE
jgi:hypothetical protein